MQNVFKVNRSIVDFRYDCTFDRRVRHRKGISNQGPFIDIAQRANKELVAINAAAIQMYTRSELFGHRRGAFTGADARRLGRFEQANGGTLFLDEIGDMSLDLQARLLRVLANGEFYRVGGEEAIVTDVRLIAATNHKRWKIELKEVS